MTILTAQVSIGTTATPLRLDARAVLPEMALLVYNRGAAPIFIGGSGVTASTGFQVDPDQRMSVPMGGAGGGLFAVTASGTSSCHVFQADSYA